MQQTKFDRWLQSRYVNETLVITVRQPPYVPKGIVVEELPQSLNNRYRYQMVISDAKELDKILTELKKLSQTYTTRVRQRKGLAKFFFAHESGRSFSISLISAILGASAMFWVVLLFPDILIEYADLYLVPPILELKDSLLNTAKELLRSAEEVLHSQSPTEGIEQQPSPSNE
ncbi:hypothetical protein [Sulfuriroseicoccus oceanibius]|uniref:Uncharacterized protein n=1 Tax=Sulfuriroseicoccus oceanibius TaxID=2707525 RepID=A0A6B3L3Y1_9BACT|nr:hypothetical protein [Sulfuriroseicoccus oceanibius]QQL44488.1 hypothetical protein G3M56_011440 [Sulfuriroseicoccus oceanibius]